MELNLLYILIVSIVCIGLFFFRPKIAFFVMLFMRPVIDNIPILRTVYIIGDFNVLKIIGLLFPLLLIMTLLLSNSFLFRQKIANIYLIYIISCVPSVFMSNSLFSAWSYVFQIFTFWAVLVYVLHIVENEKDINDLFFVIFVASFYPIIRFIFSFLTNETVIVDHNLDRTLAGYLGMGVISGLMYLFIPSYLFFYEQTSKLFKKILIISLLLLMIFCIYKTYYRSTIVATLIFLLSYLFLKKKFFTLSFLFAIAISALVFSPFLRERFSDISFFFEYVDVLFSKSNNSFDYLLSGRFGIWRRMTTSFLYDSQIQNIFFGFGVSPIIMGYKIAPHNDYWSALFQHGLISFFIFLFFIISLIQLGLRGLPRINYKIFLSLLISGLFFSITENYLVSVRNLLYLGVYVGIMIKSIDLYNLNIKKI